VVKQLILSDSNTNELNKSNWFSVTGFFVIQGYFCCLKLWFFSLPLLHLGTNIVRILFSGAVWGVMM
jgi:hypothetical protein